MIRQKDLDIIREALPKGGYQRVADKTGRDKSVVGKVLRNPKYYNKAIIEAALEIVKEYKAELLDLKSKIEEITNEPDRS